MARRMMQVPACVAHLKKGEEVPGIVPLTLGDRFWDLCLEHAERFGAHFEELFSLDGEDAEEEEEEGEDEEEEEQEERPAVVITGNVDGYTAPEIRSAVERMGYTIAGHADANTAFVIVGKRPASHKIKEAREHETPVINAQESGVLKAMISAGELKPNGEMPAVKGKLTAADVREGE
ncbi:hypothetical protein [Streptomyces decoyicus]